MFKTFARTCGTPYEPLEPALEPIQSTYESLLPFEPAGSTYDPIEPLQPF